MKPSNATRWEHTRSLAVGKTWVELETWAKHCKDKRLSVDPEIVLGLLRSYARLYEETAALRQLDMFPASQIQPKTRREP